MAQFTRQARAGVLSRMAAATTGFNDVYASIVSGYPEADPNFQLHWDDLGRDVLLSNVDPEVAKEGSPDLQYPLALIYAEEVDNSQEQKGRQVSGGLIVVLEFWFSWPEGNFPCNTEDQIDAIEETVATVLNNGATQDWGPGVSWICEFNSPRGPVLMGGLHWRQQISFRLPFIVTT